jgi:DNA-binding MarR family transcriptional regulator
VTAGSATAAAAAGPSSAAGARPVSFRPQALLLTVLGRHLLDREGVAVGAGTFIAVLERLGVSEQAARSTLTRMVRRGLLDRRQHGRRAYFTLTGGSRALLLEGRERIFAPAPVRQHWDGMWTLLSFSIPESRRDERHRLRARLAWNGFGLLRDGLWLAPGRAEVGRLRTRCCRSTTCRRTGRRWRRPACSVGSTTSTAPARPGPSRACSTRSRPAGAEPGTAAPAALASPAPRYGSTCCLGCSSRISVV